MIDNVCCLTADNL